MQMNTYGNYGHYMGTVSVSFYLHTYVNYLLNYIMGVSIYSEDDRQNNTQLSKHVWEK